MLSYQTKKTFIIIKSESKRSASRNSALAGLLNENKNDVYAVILIMKNRLYIHRSIFYRNYNNHFMTDSVNIISNMPISTTLCNLKTKILHCEGGSALYQLLPDC